MGSARTALPREAVMVLTGHVWAGGLDDVLDHGAAEVALGDDAVGPELVIGGHGAACPALAGLRGRATRGPGLNDACNAV
jgi:hypothetical protein